MYQRALLTKHVWKTFGGPEGCLQHDSYLCKAFPGSVPWPTQRPMTPCNFVGCVFKQNVTLTEKCPLQCRPPTILLPHLGSSYPQLWPALITPRPEIQACWPVLPHTEHARMQAMLRVCKTGNNLTMRCMPRTHGVSAAWLHDRGKRILHD